MVLMASVQARMPVLDRPMYYDIRRTMYHNGR
jgi:hypothetical protein